VRLVGCDLVADSYGLALRATPGAPLTACFDVVEERLVAFARRFGCTPVDSLAVLASWCDAAVACTPPGTHATTVGQLVGAGRDVLCEKELATPAESALRMVEAAKAAGRVLAVGFRFRTLTVLGSAGTLTADYLGRRIDVRTGRKFRTEDVTGLDVAGVPDARLDFVRQMEDFVGAVHVRRRPAADGVASYQAVRALLRLVEESGWAQ
jgi:predicted dehydrogenase